MTALSDLVKYAQSGDVQYVRAGRPKDFLRAFEAGAELLELHEAVELAREAMAIVTLIKSKPTTKIIHSSAFDPERRLFWNEENQQWEVFSRDGNWGTMIIWHYKGENLNDAIVALTESI